MKHFVRILDGTLDLISEDNTMTCIRHIPTHFNLDLFEVEISQATAQAILEGDYTIDHNPGLDWVMVNGEIALPTAKSFRFIPKFVVSLPLETLRILKVAGVEESWVRLYAYKNSLWAEPGPWGTRSEMTISQPIGNFGFVVPQCNIPPEIITSVEIYVCDKWCYLHLQTADSDVYIQMAEIAEIV